MFPVYLCSFRLFSDQCLCCSSSNGILTCLYGPYGPPLVGPVTELARFKKHQNNTPSSNSIPVHFKSSYNLSSASGTVLFYVT